MSKCNDDCLNCSLPSCKYDKHDTVKKAKIRETTKAKSNGKFNYHEYYERNQEKIKKRNRQRYQEKREEILAKQKVYREAHRKEWRKGGKYYAGK